MTGSGRVTSGWREATRSCRASTSRPSAPEQCTTTVDGTGRTAAATAAIALSGTVISTTSTATAADETSSARPRTPRTSTPATSRARARDRPVRPGPMMRTVVMLSSFRSGPVDQVPFVSQVASSVPTTRRSSDTGSVTARRPRHPAGTREASSSSSGARTKPRSAILGWGTTRSGSAMLRSSTRRTSTSQGARAVANRADPPRRVSRRRERLRSSRAAEVSFESDDAVEEGALTLGPAERRRLVYGRDGEIGVEVPELAHRGGEMAQAIAKVGAQAEKRLHVQPARRRPARAAADPRRGHVRRDPGGGACGPSP